MKVLSLDQSTVKTGWSYFINGKYKKHGVIDLSKQKDSTQRFMDMCSEISKLLDLYKADVVVLEDVALQTNVSVLVTLSRIQGVIIQKCISLNESFYIIKPTEWRKLLDMAQGKLKRKELKVLAINYAKDFLKTDKLNEDESDAICICIAYNKLISNLKENI